MSKLTDLQAILPGLVVSCDEAGGAIFTRTLTPAEWQTALTVLDPIRAKREGGKKNTVATIAASNLIGKTYSEANSGPERAAVLHAVCQALGFLDQDDKFLDNPVNIPQGPTAK